jgi:1,5-anhydro-D-fructose reductase (1,5-anhydro-D-mannitol-forming)
MSSQDRVGWGIVGLGNIAQRMARAIAAVPRASLAHVCGRDAARSAAFAAEHGAAASTDRFEALLADEAVDAVYVATPNLLHAEQTIAALEAGKHVLVEKPMALSLAQGEAMADAARAAGRQLGLGFHLRYHPVHQEMRRRIQAGDIGEVVYATAQWGSNPVMPKDLWHIDPAVAGFGSLGGLGVHLLDLVPWLVGDEVAEVVAFDDRATYGAMEYLTLATLRFAHGAHAHVVSSRRLPFSTQTVTVYGSEGRLDGSGTLAIDPAGELLVTRAGGTEPVSLPLPDLYELEARAFTEALLGGEPFAASGEDGVRSMALMEAIQAAAGGGAVAVAQTMGDRHG